MAILGFTFKENCPDTRNTKVIDIYRELQEYGITPVVYDPEADADEAKRLYGITFSEKEALKDLDAVLIAVKHHAFEALTPDDIAAFYAKERETKILVDLKGMFQKEDFGAPAFSYWRL